ncbi:MAG: hypothetical protein WAM91_17280 [Candidatus Acidiferrales bacterium]
MKKLTLVFALSLFALPTQAQSDRTKYCSEHPTDPTKCKIIQTVPPSNPPIATPVVCGGDEEKQNLDSLLRLDGMDEDTFEDAGLCTLTRGEINKLVDWHFSRKASRIYYPNASRSPKHIYVYLHFAPETPLIVQSAFRSQIRSLNDIELTESHQPDIILEIASIPLRLKDGHLAGYLLSCSAEALWNVPDFPLPKYLTESLAPRQLSMGAENEIDSIVREQVAAIDNQAFEEFRKSYPYNQSGK